MIRKGQVLDRETGLGCATRADEVAAATLRRRSRRQFLYRLSLRGYQIQVDIQGHQPIQAFGYIAVPQQVLDAVQLLDSGAASSACPSSAFNVLVCCCSTVSRIVMCTYPKHFDSGALHLSVAVPQLSTA